MGLKFYLGVLEPFLGCYIDKFKRSWKNRCHCQVIKVITEKLCHFVYIFPN